MFDAIEETTPTVTLSVSIGRNDNRSGEPMPLLNWQAFKNHLRAELAAKGFTLYGAAEGHGNYNGSGEECYLITGTLTGHDARALRPRLARLAALFGQDAIGVIEQCNTDTLIHAS